jgi:hypothetical protein
MIMESSKKAFRSALEEKIPNNRVYVMDVYIFQIKPSKFA